MVMQSIHLWKFILMMLNLNQQLKKLGIAVDLRRVLDGFVEAFRLDEEGLPRGHPYDLGV